MKHIKSRIIFALLVVITMLAIECPTLNINADEPLEKIEELDPVAMEMSRILNLNKEKEAELEEKTKESVLEFTETELEVQERIQDINEELIEELEAALPKKTYLGSYELTAYIATGNPCASGVYPQVNHTVACNSLPMGTRIYIEGYGEYVVEDTGGMANNVIDVFVSDYSTAINFGRRVAEVYIIEE